MNRPSAGARFLKEAPMTAAARTFWAAPSRSPLSRSVWQRRRILIQRAGVEVGTSPNVGWWSDGAQPYCHSLVPGERMVRVRDFDDGLDNLFPNPWSASTDQHGEATLALPSGHQFLQIVSDAYELPILRAAPGSGMSDAHVVDVWLHSGKPTGATLDLQPRGTEKLGDPP